MTYIPAFDNKFAQTIEDALVAAIAKAKDDLGSGTQHNRVDAAATGMNCVAYMGRIAGLEEARTIMRHTYDVMTGRKKETR